MMLQLATQTSHLADSADVTTYISTADNDREKLLNDYSTVPQRKKFVHFADTKGLALTSIFFFAAETFSPQDYRGRIIAHFDVKNRCKLASGGCANLLNFTSPIPDINDCLSKDNVSLEKIMCNKNGIYGRIQVQNIAFEKRVFLRYTFDSWRTKEDVDANFIPGASTHKVDTFFFHVRPPVLCSGECKMEFAICYMAGKVNQFWSNNYGDNFRLIYRRL